MKKVNKEPVKIIQQIEPDPINNPSIESRFKQLKIQFAFYQAEKDNE